MDGTIRTRDFTIDRAAYLKAMWTRNLWMPTLRLGVVCLAVIVVALSLVYGTGVLVGGLPGTASGLDDWTSGSCSDIVLCRRNVYRPESAKLFDDPRTVEFSSQSFTTRSEGGIDSTVPWTHVVKVERRGGFTLLFLGPIVHLIVPDDAFASETDRGAFDDLLRSRELPGA